jgi:hypothetical protein
LRCSKSLRPSGGSGPHYLFSTRPIAAALPGRTNPAKDKAFTVPMLPASRGKSRMHKAIAPANLRVMLHLVFGGRAHGCSIYQPIGAFVFPSNFGGDPAGRAGSRSDGRRIYFAIAAKFLPKRLESVGWLLPRAA